jgi:glycosyltransferase involved in cell wall biosynthesis
MKKQKILHICQLIGGLDIYVRNSIIYSDSNFEFIVVRGEGDTTTPIIKEGKIVKEYKVKLFRELNFLNDIKCIFQVIKILKNEKPDIIHCHSAKGGVIGRITGFITRTKTFYTPHAFSFLSTQNNITKYIYILIERYMKFGAILLACSESERQLGIITIKYRKTKALLWSNSSPDSTSLISNDSSSVNKDKYVTYIGRPCFQKNTLFLVDVVKEVVKQIPNFKIMLLGVGYHSPDLDKLKELIKSNNLGENFILIDWITQQNALNIIQKSYFYLSVSRYEGLPLAVIEAMSLSKALILSDVLGNIDCVVDDQNGYLIPIDKDLFAYKIIEIWNDDAKIKRLGANSRKKFIEEFNIKNQIKLLEIIYSN